MTVRCYGTHFWDSLISIPQTFAGVQDRLGQDSYGEVSWPEVRQPGSSTPTVDERIF